jgi:predicted alpha/beta-hydrolase family hydrolase
MPPAKADKPEHIRVDVSPSDHVTALVYRSVPDDRIGVTLILAHGAGADQNSGFMVHFATALAERGVDTVTFNFVYTEQGRRAGQERQAGKLLARRHRVRPRLAVSTAC